MRRMTNPLYTTLSRRGEKLLELVELITNCRRCAAELGMRTTADLLAKAKKKTERHLGRSLPKAELN